MDESTPEWESTLSLVIFCLSEKTLAALLEGTKPSLLGRMTYSYPNFIREFIKFVLPDFTISRIMYDSLHGPDCTVR